MRAVCGFGRGSALGTFRLWRGGSWAAGLTLGPESSGRIAMRKCVLAAMLLHMRKQPRPELPAAAASLFPRPAKRPVLDIGLTRPRPLPTIIPFVVLRFPDVVKTGLAERRGGLV